MYFFSIPGSSIMTGKNRVLTFQCFPNLWPFSKSLRKDLCILRRFKYRLLILSRRSIELFHHTQSYFDPVDFANTRTRLPFSSQQATKAILKFFTFVYIQPLHIETDLSFKLLENVCPTILWRNVSLVLNLCCLVICVYSYRSIHAPPLLNVLHVINRSKKRAFGIDFDDTWESLQNVFPLLFTCTYASNMRSACHELGWAA